MASKNQMAEDYSICSRTCLRIAPRVCHHGHAANTLWRGQHWPIFEMIIIIAEQAQ